MEWMIAAALMSFLLGAALPRQADRLVAARARAEKQRRYPANAGFRR